MKSNKSTELLYKEFLTAWHSFDVERIRQAYSPNAVYISHLEHSTENNNASGNDTQQETFYYQGEEEIYEMNSVFSKAYPGFEYEIKKVLFVDENMVKAEWDLHMPIPDSREKNCIMTGTDYVHFENDKIIQHIDYYKHVNSH